jgi:hypothetical protein
MEMPPDLVDALRAFNRKERFLLVGWALDRATFPLGHEFRMALSQTIDVDVPADAYVAMDYHLSWLYCAMMWASGKAVPETPLQFTPDRSPFQANIEDADLLVAFAMGTGHQVVLIEAKGYTPWSSKQVEHKIERLDRMLYDDGSPIFPEMSVHLVFVGSTSPRIKKTWPKWVFRPGTVDVAYLALPQPSSGKVLVERCDSHGNKSAAGGHWVIRSTRWPGKA